MGIEVKPVENEGRDIISEAYDKAFNKEEAVIEESEENIEEVESSEDATLEEEEVKEEVETAEEVADEEEIEEKEVNLSEDLHGVFNKDHINLLESIEDQELRAKLIDAGKLQRADLDRKRLNLGESRKLVETLDEVVKENNLNYNRKQYADLVKNFINFDALFARDPKLAIQNLAKTANIDLNSINGNPVQEAKTDDLDDYRTPEEVARDDKLKILEQELNQLKNQRQQEEQVSVQQEINNFANARDDKGNLKHPHFDKVRENMGLFFNDKNPNMTMELAYKKAILLDDELRSQRDDELIRKKELERKVKIEKAKKLKKQTIHSTKVSSSISDPREKTLAAVDAFLAAG